MLASECYLAGGRRSHLQDLRGPKFWQQHSLQTDSLPCTGRATTSICGRYCAFVQGTHIRVCRLEAAFVRPIAVVACWAEVSACCISASEEGLFLAALLCGRVGLSVDLTSSDHAADCETAISAIDMDAEAGTTISRPSTTASVGSAGTPSIDAGLLGSQQLLYASVDRGARTWSESLRTRRGWVRRLQGSFKGLTNYSHPDSGSDGAWATAPRVKPGISLQNVCFSTEPPISVAISPNGRCIAFGSRSSVEMYWVRPALLCEIAHIADLPRSQIRGPVEL